MDNEKMKEEARDIQFARDTGMYHLIDLIAEALTRTASEAFESGKNQFQLSGHRESNKSHLLLIQTIQSLEDRLAEKESLLGKLIVVSGRLLERIDFNGGLGEYKGGPSFVVKDLRDLLAEIKLKKGGGMNA